MEQVTPHKQNLIDRVKNLIVTPQSEWNVIAAEQPDSAKIVIGYVLPLALLSAAAAFLGYGFIWGFATINWGIYEAIIVLATAILSVYISALVIDMLAPSFGAEKNFGRAVQLVAYSFTPAWIGGILNIYPPIAIVGAIFGIYGLYLLYIGMPKLKNAPADKHTGYFVVSLLVMIIVYIVLGIILSKILASVFGLGILRVI